MCVCVWVGVGVWGCVCMFPKAVVCKCTCAFVCTVQTIKISYAIHENKYTLYTIITIVSITMHHLVTFIPYIIGYWLIKSKKESLSIAIVSITMHHRVTF